MEPRVLVCQQGARHRYAIPRMFEEAGVLAALYTDSTFFSQAGRFAAGVRRAGIKRSDIEALSARIPSDIPRNKVYSSDRPMLSRFLKGRVSPDLGNTFIRWGLQHANVVYSMCGESYEFLSWAKQQGARLILDTFIHPGTARLIGAEAARVLPGDNTEQVNVVEDSEEFFCRRFELADIILCPSNWVADGVRECAEDQASKIRVVPYGSSVMVKPAINVSPHTGRVLFAGREPLRKGLHYLAEAAHRVREQGVELDVRVAGVGAADVSWMKYHQDLNCLGTLPLDQMQQEFWEADVVVLPSLSEGQAGVLLEAMACGCPVIATRESGVDFDSDAGITVPARDAGALASAIQDVVTNRMYRNQLAAGALRQASGFTMEAWKQRLMKLVEELG